MRYFGDFVKASIDANDNDLLELYLKSATDVLSDIVLEVNQTYVNTLKSNGEFTLEAQKHAKEVAINKAKLLISENAREALTAVYGDLSVWIETQIESEVLKAKKESGSV